ncbi:MAG: D-xylose ABC transporter substrate-binding protein [Alphaproteobacteria bacterium]
MNVLKRGLFGVAAVVVLSSFAAAPVLAQVVGVSWANFQEERWKKDEAAMKEILDAAGATYISADAQSSNEKQIADIESLITRGADALIVLPWDSDAVRPGIEKAKAEGIPVVGYDRLIEDPEVFYITFDNKEVGRLQAAEVFRVQPEGNYVFIKGFSGDPNADFVHGGQLEILQEAIDAGKINVVGEQYTDGWLPENAQKNMEQILTATNNNVDAVVASNDGTASGVVAALTAQGMEGTPVSGQDGDFTALNRVALGTQTVSVWKDARELGREAARVALELAAGTSLDGVEGAVVFSDGPKGEAMNSVLLAPMPITRDNLDVVIDAGWIGRDVVCQGVTDNPPAACQ